MPKISEFYGVIIYLYYRDHSPAHVHAFYAGWEGSVEILSGRLLAGDLPVRARRLVHLWTARHRTELLDNWDRARRGEEVFPIPPLE